MQVRIAVEYGKKTIERTYETTTLLAAEYNAVANAIDALDKCYRETHAALLAEAELLHAGEKR